MMLEDLLKMDLNTLSRHSSLLLNESVVFLSHTFPGLSQTLWSITNNTISSQVQLISDFQDFLTNPMLEKERERMYQCIVDIAMYAFLCCTSVATAVVATKTFVSYVKPFKRVMRVVYRHIEDWFLFLFSAIWLMYVSQPYGMCVIWRLSVKLYMRLRYGPLGDLTTGNDSAASLDTPEAREIIKSLKILKGKCNLEEIREKVEATACKRNPSTGHFLHPKFHQCQDRVGGFCVWKPSLPFDVKYHVRYVEGMDENTPSVGEGQLVEIVSKVSNLPFGEKRSMWEILVVPRVHFDDDQQDPDEQEPKFALVCRISHGIGDGFSFMKLVFREMAGVDAGEYTPPSRPSNTSWPMKIATFCYLFFKASRSFYFQMNFRDHNPLHNTKIKMSGEKVHIWSNPLSVEWLKALKTELGCGMSTVFLNNLASACRRYMMTQYGMSESELPKKMFSLIPVPAPNHPDDRLVNKFSVVMLPLEMRKPRAIQRCKEIARRNKIMSQSPDCYMNLFLMDLISVFPVEFTRYFIVNSQCTTVISNLPGPTKQISLWGWPVLDMMFWLPNVGTSGISVSHLSYGNKLRVGLAIDTGVIKEGRKGADMLLRWMLEDLKNLARSVGLPCDDETMFIRRNNSRSSRPDPTLKLDKDEVASEDYGYGGEPSDISSNTDTDEDLEEMGKLTGRGGKEKQEEPSTREGEGEEEDDEYDLVYPNKGRFCNTRNTNSSTSSLLLSKNVRRRQIRLNQVNANASRC